MCLQTSSDLQQAQQIRLGMGEGGPQLFPGALSAAVTAAMHAVPSGSIYWGDAAVQTGQDMPGDGEGLQHEGALQPQLTSQGVSQSYEPVYQSKHAGCHADVAYFYDDTASIMQGWRNIQLHS